MKVALLIDGGHLRAWAHQGHLQYTPDFIEEFARICHDSSTEDVLRILYYDSPQYRGKQALPVSSQQKAFQASDAWLHNLARRDLFAVRRGTLAFRGWKLRKIPISNRPLTDSDFQPNFEQKGVDMRLGLDIATFSNARTVERIILVSADQDMIPAMKYARISGLQIVAIQFPEARPPLTERFLAHVDFTRKINVNKLVKKYQL